MPQSRCWFVIVRVSCETWLWPCGKLALFLGSLVVCCCGSYAIILSVTYASGATVAEAATVAFSTGTHGYEFG